MPRFLVVVLSCYCVLGAAAIQGVEDVAFRSLDKAKGWSIEYKLEATKADSSVAFLVIPANSKIYSEITDFGDTVHRDTGVAKTGKDWGSDLALESALAVGVGVVAVPVALIRDFKKYKRVYTTTYPNHDLQNAIIASKNENGEIMKICDSESVITDYPARSFFEKFTAHNLERFDKYTKKKHKFSIVKFKPECFTSSDNRMLVLYTFAQSKRGGFRYGKTTLADDFKQAIAKDFGLEYKAVK